MEFDLFQKLVNANAIDSLQAQNITDYHSGNANDSVVLDREVTAQLDNGVIAGRLLEYVAGNIDKEKSPGSSIDVDKLSQIKKATTAPAKLFNWNLILKEVVKLDIQIDSDTRSLIIAGDLDIISDLLKQISDFVPEKGAYNSSGNEKPEKTAKKKKIKEGVDILSMDPNKKANK